MSHIPRGKAALTRMDIKPRTALGTIGGNSLRDRHAPSGKVSYKTRVADSTEGWWKHGPSVADSCSIFAFLLCFSLTLQVFNLSIVYIPCTAPRVVLQRQHLQSQPRSRGSRPMLSLRGHPPSSPPVQPHLPSLLTTDSPLLPTNPPLPSRCECVLYVNCGLQDKTRHLVATMLGGGIVWHTVDIQGSTLVLYKAQVVYPPILRIRGKCPPIFT